MLIKSRPKLLSYNGIVDELTCVNTEKKKNSCKKKNLSSFRSSQSLRF